MRNRVGIVVIVVLAGGGLLWLTVLRSAAPPARPAVESVSKMDESRQVFDDSTSSPNQRASSEVASIWSASEAPEAVPVRPKPVALAATAEPPEGPEAGPGLKPLTVMENIRSVFRQYNARFGGNPVGTNPEITAALAGRNPRQVEFLQPDDGMRTNDRGELVDNWGTPFFFHQLSAAEMEIRSAGPDRKMWTRDDLVIK